MRVRLRFAGVVCVAAILTAASTPARAYTVLGYVWPQATMRYVVNPATPDLSAGDVLAAVRDGADAWQQSGTAFTFVYGGATTQATTTDDGVNVVVFRNATSGSALATTYTWYSGGALVDADIVFWDAGFRFFAGSTGCSGGFYVEDVAAHEFGHALGLGHSMAPSATMYPTVSTCSEANRTLDPDDIAAVLSLYPALAARPAPPSGLRIIRF